MSDGVYVRPGQRIWLLLALLATMAVYLVGLKGGFVFDDFPNIVDNGVLLPIRERPLLVIDQDRPGFDPPFLSSKTCHGNSIRPDL